MVTVDGCWISQIGSEGVFLCSDMVPLKFVRTHILGGLGPRAFGPRVFEQFSLDP